MTKDSPQQFGKYLLIERIAVGGMAEIFKAKVTGEGGFEKLVAIKRILPHLSSNTEFITMFMKEARLAALLGHQNIVQIYDFGNEGGIYYIAMEYLWGKDLKSVLKKVEGKQPIRLECALYIASRICAGLEYSHNLRDLSGNPLNMIHRDVNPQNIFITHQGEIKIIDFGIAKVAEKDSGTRVGVLKGKVSYMSPEQASGLPIDKRSDIFSTGVLLYEMVTGEKPFQGETMEVLQKVRNAEYRAPELAAPGLPSEVYEIIHTALAKSPEQRFQSCAEMLERLESCLMLFSERQNAENLSRHIRNLFSDDFSLEARPAAKIEAYLSALQEEATEETDRTMTIAQDAGDLETPFDLDEPVRRRFKILPLLAGLCLLAAVAAAFLYFKVPGAAKPDRVDEAMAALQNGESGKALELFEKILADRPELAGRISDPYSAALLQEASTVLRTDPEKGRQLLLRSAAIDPQNPKAHFELGKLYTRLQHYPEAIESYREAARLDPNSPDTFFNLGFLYAKAEDYARGEEMFLKTISLSPSYLDEAYFNLAVVQRSQGKSEECLKALEEALAINPENTKALEFINKIKREQ